MRKKKKYTSGKQELTNAIITINIKINATEHMLTVSHAVLRICLYSIHFT